MVLLAQRSLAPLHEAMVREEAAALAKVRMTRYLPLSLIGQVAGSPPQEGLMAER